MKQYQMVFLMVAMFSIGTVWANFNTNGEKGVQRTYSARTFDPATMHVGFSTNYAQSSDYVQGPTGFPAQVLKYDGTTYSVPVAYEDGKMFSANLFLGFGFTGFWDLALSVPAYYDWSGFGINKGGIGDVDISTKFMLPLGKDIERLLYHGYLFDVTVPVGMRNAGVFPRHPYFKADTGLNPASNFYSSDYPAVKVLMLWTLDFGNISKVPLRFNLNIGGVFTEASDNQRNTMIGSAALEYTPLDFLSLYLDFSGESRWSNFAKGYKLDNDPLWLTPGIKINTPAGIYLQLSGDFSLASSKPEDRNQWQKDGYYYSTGVTPKYGVNFAFGWNGFITEQDFDKDGIKDNVDRCPRDAEDIDNFQDNDGCPDYDNDSDGIPDSLDKCHNVVEDKDGFQDEDGCPDLDNDKDGMPDLKDKCPNAPEDFDGYEDTDGCPDVDNDKDGVLDSLDKCINQPEDFDKYQDDDGCPDLDNDKDGMPDLKDKCPNDPEVFNGFEDDDGCPDSIKKAECDLPREQTLRGIQFSNNSTEMTFGSYIYLDPIVDKLKQFPDVTIDVRAYTDGLGKAQANIDLSQMRSESVKQYFISKGVAGSRIKAVGYGPNNPIGDNRTAAGRAQNRRIVIVRTK